jgi:hypothetical protein
MSGGERKHHKASGSAPEDPESLAEERLVAVWNAPDETTATAVRDFLAGQGIEATAVPVLMPWFGTVEADRRGWGNIEVLESHAEQARRLIQDFFTGRPEPDKDGERG